MTKGQEQFTDDGNMGLVKQVLSLIQYRIVRKISRIYEAIPLKKLAKKLGFDENVDGVNATESLLLQIALRQKNSKMSLSTLTKSHIDFSIDSDSSVAYFYEVGFYDDDDTEVAVDRKEREHVQMELSKRVALAMDLAERVTKMDIAVTTSPKYQTIIGRKSPDDADDLKS